MTTSCSAPGLTQPWPVLQGPQNTQRTRTSHTQGAKSRTALHRQHPQVSRGGWAAAFLPGQGPLPSPAQATCHLLPKAKTRDTPPSDGRAQAGSQEGTRGRPCPHHCHGVRGRRALCRAPAPHTSLSRSLGSQNRFRRLFRCTLRFPVLERGQQQLPLSQRSGRCGQGGLRCRSRSPCSPHEFPVGPQVTSHTTALHLDTAFGLRVSLLLSPITSSPQTALPGAPRRRCCGRACGPPSSEHQLVCPAF